MLKKGLKTRKEDGSGDGGINIQAFRSRSLFLPCQILDYSVQTITRWIVLASILRNS